MMGLLFVSCEEKNIDEPTHNNPVDKPDDGGDDENPDDSEKAVFEIDGDGNYIIAAAGGEFEVTVTTNIEYSVDIPKDAKSWLSVIDTRAVRIENVVLYAAANTISEMRSATVRMLDSDDKELISLTIIQKGKDEVEKPNIPFYEIWYTSTDGEIVEPYYKIHDDDEYTDAFTTFGANIISNTYYDGMGIIAFDGNVKTIGDYAFMEGNLKSIIIPESVTTIGDSAFIFSDLTSVTIPDSVTTIGDLAFGYCNDLISVTIGSGLTTVGLAPFGYCDSIEVFYGKFAAENGRCLIVDNTLVAYAKVSGTEFTIPNGVTTIGYAVFNECESLTNVTIPSSVTTIRAEAFYDCTSLESITIPNGVTSIEAYAFGGCNSLKSITLPESLESLGYSCYEDHGEYEEVYGNPFGGCNSMEAFYGKFASNDNRCLIIDCVLNSFAPAGITEYTIPDSVTTIGSSAFEVCGSLTSVTIPDSVTTIGYGAFVDCSSLTNVTIGSGVKMIGNYAFAFCYSLTNVYCRATTPPAGDYNMFKDNASDRKIYVPTASLEAYKTADGWSEYADYIVGYDF